MCQVTRENQAIFHIIIVGGVFLEKKVIKEGLSYFYTNDADRLILLLNDLINYRDRTILTCLSQLICVQHGNMHEDEIDDSTVVYLYFWLFETLLAKFISDQMD